jgi:TfoX/Sxy family transcriptional regulator of competence genes
MMIDYSQFTKETLISMNHDKANRIKIIEAEARRLKQEGDKLAQAGYSLETALMKFAERWGEDTEEARQAWNTALTAWRRKP